MIITVRKRNENKERQNRTLLRQDYDDDDDDFIFMTTQKYEYFWDKMLRSMMKKREVTTTKKNEEPSHFELDSRKEMFVCFLLKVIFPFRVMNVLFPLKNVFLSFIHEE